MLARIRGMLKYLVLLLAPGCGSMAPSRLQEAVDMVWRSYGAPPDEPPPEVSIYPHRCVYHHADGACVDGVFISEEWAAIIGKAPSYHESSLSHELYHADEMRRWGDADAEHLGRGWAWLVPDAEDLLRDAGL